MKKIKVIPFHRDGYTAPYLIEEIEKTCKNPYETAIERAKKRTRLSDFPKAWMFYTEFISYV